MNPELEQAKSRFVDSWGEMASRWGINKTMARAHALLMAAERPLSTDEIMSALSISRGNANMNLRALADWGLVRRATVDGERKEFFLGEKDAWTICCRIARERRRREVEPVIDALEGCLKAAGSGKEAAAFRRQISDLQELVRLLDFVLGKLGQLEKKAVLPKVLGLMKAMG